MTMNTLLNGMAENPLGLKESKSSITFHALSKLLLFWQFCLVH